MLRRINPDINMVVEPAYMVTLLFANPLTWEPYEFVIDATLVHFGRSATDEDVLDSLERFGLRPGNMVEGLALEAQHPQAEPRLPVVILGSVWANAMGIRYVGCLLGRGSSRYVVRSWANHRWPSGYRFLAVRE